MSTLFKLPKWATSGTVVEPSEGKKDLGWAGTGEKPPFQTFNWLQKKTYEWLLNLSGSAASYATLAQFIEKAEPGDTGIIKPNFATFAPLAQLSTSADFINTIDTDGEVYATREGTTFKLRSRANINTVIRTFTPTNAVTNAFKAVTNGIVVACIHDTWLELFNRDTGASIWTYNHGATITDVAIDSRRVYICGATSTGVNARAIDITAGTATWAYFHDALLNAIATDGVRVYTGGNAAGAGADSTAGTHIVGLTATDGTLEWDVTDAAIAGYQRITTDGESVFYVGATTNVRRVAADTGSIAETSTLGSVVQVTLDSDYLYLLTSLGVYILPRCLPMTNTGLIVRVTQSNVATVCSDGDQVAVGASSVTASRTLNRMGTRARIWRRADTSTTGDVFLPYSQLAYTQG